MSEKVSLEFTDGGSLNKLNTGAEKIKANLEGAAAASKRIAAPVAAAKQGVANSNMRTAGGQVAEDSNSARGVMGATGAAGRDFSAQARGLGGLVHVYATFAANLFAVSAAFTALNKAANIDNMIKGLDQLGVASGRNLGQVAKGLMEVTDGALSLADSMTAVAQASAGGMSSQNVLRMGEVAKKASQALGRDMSDAINRLSRGITKIEPELLDELGIMVKVDEASREYARTLGKTAASLSDFEKRQGYANAVLAEGERKFGSINLDANPYQKIQASINNLAQSTGSLINDYLGPLLNILSASPTALATTLGLIATSLLRQAIPAISLWREKMEGAAQTARKTAIEANKLRVARRDEALNDIAAELGKKEGLATAKTKALADQLMANTRVAKSTAELLKAVTTGDMDPDKIAALEKQAAIRGKLSLLEEGASKRRVANAAERQKEAEGIRQVTAAAREELAVALERAKATGELERGKVQKVRSGIFGYFSNDQVQTRIADRAVAKSQQADILSGVAKNLPEKGMIQSWRDLNKEISNARNSIKSNGEEWDKNEKAMGRWNAEATRVKGALAIITSGVTTLARSLSSLFFYIGIAVAVYQTLNAVFSTAQKETTKFSSALEGVDASIENVSRTIDGIEKGGFEKAFSVESIQARANAFGELTDSVDVSLKAFNKMKEAQGWWEKGWDWVADKLPFIDSAAEKLVQSFAASIQSSFKLLQGGPLQGKAQKIIEDTFGISNVDFSKPKEFEKAIAKLNLTQEQFAEKAKSSQTALSQLSKEFSNTASYTTAFASNLTEIGKLVGDMNTALLPKDNAGKIGQELISASRNMAIALQEPTTAMAGLIKLSGDMKSLSLLPPETAQQLIKAKQELELISARLAESKEKLEKVKATPIQKIQQLPKEDAINRGLIETLNRIAEEANKQRQEAIRASEEQVGVWTRAANSAAKEFGQGMDKILFTKGVENLTSSLNAALSQGGIIAAQGYLSVLKQAGGATAESEGKLQQAGFTAQLALINANYNTAKQLELNTIALEQSTLERKKGDITSKGITSSPELDEINKSLQSLSLRANFVNLPPKALIALTKAASNGDLPDVLRKAIIDSAGIFATLIGKQSQEATIRGQSAAAAANTKAAVTVETAALQKERLNTTKSILDTEIARNAEERRLIGQYTEENQLIKQQLELQALGVSYAQIEKDISVKQELAEQAKLQYGQKSIDYQSALRAIEDSKAKASAAYLKFQQDTANITNRHLNEQIAGKETIRALNAEITAKEIKDSSELANIQNTNLDNQLNFRQRMGFIQAEELADKQAAIALARQENSLAVERNTLENAWAATRASLQGKLAEAKAGGPPSGITIADKNLKDATDQYNRQVNLLEERNKSIKSGIELQKESSIELAKQEEFTKNLVSMTESLALVFGEVGAAIGAAALVMDKMGKRQLQYEGERIALEKERIELVSDNDDYEGQLKNAAKLAANAKRMTKLEEDQTISQLNNIGAIAAATKQMFDEKTAAYKVFDAVQKASAIMSMTVQAQQMAQQLAALPGLIAGGVGKLVSQAGFAGLAAAAGFIALISSLGGGGGTSVPTPGMTASEIQETQGTGTSWVDGKKVENGGGVFGDSEAKSESLLNSIEIIKDNTIEGLRYDDQILDALKSIDAGINSTAKTLYNVVGVRKGSITGASEKSTSSSGIQGLFGKTTTKEIIDSGLKLTGTFGDLADSAEGLVSIYEVIRKTTKKSGFLGIGGGTKTSEKTNLTAASPEITTEISGIFSAAEDLFVELGERIGLTAKTVTDTLDKINIGDIFVSLKGLKGEELVTEFNSVISNIMDTAAGTIFDSMKEYQKFGEGLLETTIRVIDANDKIKTALDSVGITIRAFSFDVSEALVDAAGGLDTFTDQITFFADNFLTESERLAPVMENVTTTLSSMGLSAVDTREEFADVIQALDLTTEAGRTTFTKLMELAPAFAMVYPEIEELKDSLADLVKEGQDLQDELNRLTMTEAEYNATITAGYNEKELAQFNANQLLKDEIELIKEKNALTDKSKSVEVALLKARGKGLEAIALERSRELATINPANRALQMSIWAREDEIDAINRGTSAISSIRSQFASIQAAATSSAAAVASASSAITNGYIAAQDKVKAAQANITNNLIAARQNVASAMQSVAAINEQTADELRGLAKNIRDFIESISTSDLGVNSSKDQLAILKTVFTEEAKAAKSGDKDALANITNTSQRLLELAKTQSATKLEYARTVGTVTSVLDAIAAQTEATAGPDSKVDDPMLAAQMELAAATAELNRWQQAAAESGASTAETESDYLEEWRLAQADLVLWQKAVKESGASTSAAVIDYAADWRTAQAANVIAQADLSAAIRLSAGINLLQATAIGSFAAAILEYKTAIAGINVDELSPAMREALGLSAGDTSLATIGPNLGTIGTNISDLSTTISDNATAIGTLSTAVDTMGKTLSSTITTGMATLGTKISGAINTGVAILSTNIGGQISGALTTINSRTNTAITTVVGGLNTKLDKLLTKPAANDSSVTPQWTYPDHNPGGFASGGMHEGGLRIVGEKGPELEATGPSRIYSNKQTQDLLGNQELIKEIQELRKEVASLRFASQQTELHTRKTKDLLTRVSKDGDALYTAAA